jgi:hypothetical protein
MNIRKPGYKKGSRGINTKSERERGETNERSGGRESERKKHTVFGVVEHRVEAPIIHRNESRKHIGGKRTSIGKYT